VRGETSGEKTKKVKSGKGRGKPTGPSEGEGQWHREAGQVKTRGEKAKGGKIPGGQTGSIAIRQEREKTDHQKYPPGLKRKRVVRKTREEKRFREETWERQGSGGRAPLIKREHNERDDRPGQKEKGLEVRKNSQQTRNR